MVSRGALSRLPVQEVASSVSIMAPAGGEQSGLLRTMENYLIDSCLLLPIHLMHAELGCLAFESLRTIPGHPAAAAAETCTP